MICALSEDLMDKVRSVLPLGKQIDYMGCPMVVISHAWSNCYDAAGQGVVCNYFDARGKIREYQFNTEEMVSALVTASSFKARRVSARSTGSLIKVR